MLGAKTPLLQIEGTAKPRPERKPPWLRVRAPSGDAVRRTRELMRSLRLNTVCEEAACPNLGECWSQRHATVMVLGSVCTRACAFCNVKTGLPDRVDPEEPEHVASAVAELGLRHVVITSVDRDDLADGGAGHFVATIEAIREAAPGTTIEILTPDFRRKDGAIDRVAAARPDVYNHNLETVPRLYRKIRPGASYRHSLDLLARVKSLEPATFTKSGIMVGLGEEAGRGRRCDGRPARSPGRLPHDRPVPATDPAPRERRALRNARESSTAYRQIAEEKGFLLVSSSPLTRSSYHADD